MLDYRHRACTATIRAVIIYWAWALLSACQTHAQNIGDSDARLALCKSATPPASYLDTSFLGDWQSIQAGENNITYKRFGPLISTTQQGRTLLMISGSGATSSVWTPDLLLGLSKGREVITFDNPGMGYSSITDKNYSLPYTATAVVDFVEALELGQPDVLGWSLGGSIAMQAEISYPGSFAHLVLADTFTGGPTYLHSPAELALGAELAKLGSTPIPPTFIYPDTPVANAKMCDFVASLTLMPHDPPLPQQVTDQTTYGSGYLQPDYTGISDGLADIRAPTLILVGSQDVILAPANSQLLLERIPNASLLTYADAGHAAILQHDVEAAALISAFLDGSDAAGQT